MPVFNWDLGQRWAALWESQVEVKLTDGAKHWPNCVLLQADSTHHNAAVVLTHMEPELSELQAEAWSEKWPVVDLHVEQRQHGGEAGFTEFSSFLPLTKNLHVRFSELSPNMEICFCFFLIMLLIEGKSYWGLVTKLQENMPLFFSNTDPTLLHSGN